MLQLRAAHTQERDARGWHGTGARFDSLLHRTHLRRENERIAGLLERASVTLRWYAWPDRHVPRYEGVGLAGRYLAGYYSPVERDLGELAWKALKLIEPYSQYVVDVEKQRPRTELLMDKVRKGLTVGVESRPEEVEWLLERLPKALNLASLEEELES